MKNIILVILVAFTAYRLIEVMLRKQQKSILYTKWNKE
ncbi:hypothetical protein SAMN05421768_10763 [Chryseobacterium joostei]|uniref:Uncharacterized protein n=1 Tax=Chryseobacterium joostei TaxID=112234 RepID=A0A1N7IZ77_9FLAO|nr:hypothetical protein SAMN05421768_10763 [Chryseobacterium joostei]